MMAPLPKLCFVDATHTYTLDGSRILPSVTHIMRFMSRELYDGIPGETLHIAANRGTRAHEQTANLDLYGFEEQDDDTGGYITAYKAFLAAHQPVWTAVEWRGYHKGLMYAGTIDRAGYVTPDDGTGIDLVDLKCTSAFHPVMLATQLAGYAEILKSHGHTIRKRYGLQLLKDGRYVFREVGDGLKTFLHCLALNNEMAKENKP